MFKSRMAFCAAAAAAASFFAASSAQAGACASPWVTSGVIKAMGRAPSGPSAPECNMSLYNAYIQFGPGGALTQPAVEAGIAAYWRSHPQPSQIQQLNQFQSAAPAQPAGVYINGQTYSVSQLQSMQARASNGATVYLIAGRTYNVVSTGAGNYAASIASLPPGTIVATGAGNVVSTGAGNVVAQGAGNILGNSGAGILGNSAAGVQQYGRR